MTTPGITQTITSGRRPRPVKEPKRQPNYRGVAWNNDRWKVLIYADGINHYLGTYDTEEEAARVYDNKAKQLHVNPTLNFLPDGSLNSDRRRKYVESIDKHAND